MAFTSKSDAVTLGGGMQGESLSSLPRCHLSTFPPGRMLTWAWSRCNSHEGPTDPMSGGVQICLQGLGATLACGEALGHLSHSTLLCVQE